LVVLLHGLGSRSLELLPLAQRWAEDLPGGEFLLPDGFQPFDDDPRLHQWFSRRGLTDESRRERVRHASGEVSRWLDAELVRRALPPGALVVAGYSQGAMVALHLAVHRKAAPIAAVSLSGRYVDDELPEGARAGCPTAVLLLHGEDDPVIPAHRSDDAARALARIGLRARVVRSSGAGHFLVPEAFEEGAAFLAREVGGWLVRPAR
jgi:phospholipase/carboxylesterase